MDPARRGVSAGELLLESAEEVRRTGGGGGGGGSQNGSPTSASTPSPTSEIQRRQGLTLVHFSAQLEPCLTQENTLHTLNTLNTPYHPLNTGYTTPTPIPYPIQSAEFELKSGRV